MQQFNRNKDNTTKEKEKQIASLWQAPRALKMPVNNTNRQGGQEKKKQHICQHHHQQRNMGQPQNLQVEILITPLWTWSSLLASCPTLCTSQRTTLETTTTTMTMPERTWGLNTLGSVRWTQPPPPLPTLGTATLVTRKTATQQQTTMVLVYRQLGYCMPLVARQAPQTHQPPFIITSFQLSCQ